jgi:aminodeoxyfutalosine synthase
MEKRRVTGYPGSRAAESVQSVAALTVAAPRGLRTHFPRPPGNVVTAKYSMPELKPRMSRATDYTDSLRSRLAAAGLSSVAEKLEAGVRLGLEDGVRLFDSPDLLALGWLANRDRERRHAARTYYNYNIRIEATNVCVASCLFCAFARLKPGDADAYTMSLEEVWGKLRTRADQPLTEVHVVNGLHPDLPFEYYTEMLRGLKRIRPSIHLKCFTAVEIAFFADLYKMTDEQVLRELMAAGLDSLPGGGAEIFAERVRRKICHDKADADRWLSIHRLAHRLGMRSNVTMLYGHIETPAERVDHMLRARALQDETGGFQAFIPLAFHPDNNQMRKLPAPSAADTLRVHAVARLVVDNIPHVKAFWIATGVDVAQASLWFGVDDLDGTVQEEKIYHMAGARTPEAMTTGEIRRLIRAAGREPIERDTLYNLIPQSRAEVEPTESSGVVQ